MEAHAEAEGYRLNGIYKRSSRELSPLQKKNTNIQKYIFKQQKKNEIRTRGGEVRNIDETEERVENSTERQTRVKIRKSSKKEN